MLMNASHHRKGQVAFNDREMLSTQRQEAIEIKTRRMKSKHQQQHEKWREEEEVEEKNHPQVFKIYRRRFYVLLTMERLYVFF